MKKFAIILILICYTTASFGVSLNYFYCCGKLKTISIATKTKDKSCKGNLKKDCCKNQKVKVKLKSDQKVAEDNFINHINDLVYDDCIGYCNYQFSFPTATNIARVVYQLPPPHFSYKKNIYYCIYRI